MKLSDIIKRLQELEREGYGDYDMTFVCDARDTYFNESEHTYSTDQRTFDFSDGYMAEIIETNSCKDIELHQ